MPFIQQTPMDPVCAQPVLGLGPPGRPVLRAGMTPLKGLAHRPSRCAQRGSIQKAAGSGRGFYLQPGPPKLPQTSKCLLGLCFSLQFSPAPGLFFPTHLTLTPAWSLQLLALWLLPYPSLNGTTLAVPACHCFALLHQGSPRIWTNLGS